MENISEENPGNKWLSVPLSSRKTPSYLSLKNLHKLAAYDKLCYLGNMNTIRKLTTNLLSLIACARYIRIVADMAEGSGSHNPGVDFALYKSHGNDWDYDNKYTVILIGSEYNSTPWNSHYTDWWGEQVLHKFREIEEGGYF